jgi:hypothetical protein
MFASDKKKEKEAAAAIHAFSWAMVHIDIVI